MEIFENGVARVTDIYTNKALEKYTKTIHSLGSQIQNNMFKVAQIIARVDESKCYSDDGFSSVHEWCKAEFGFKSTRSHELLKIGQEYTQEIINENGKVLGYGTNLPTMQKDFTISQVSSILPLTHPVAYELVEQGELTPDMTVKQIKELVKQYRKGDEVEEEQEPEEDTREDEAPTEEAVEDMETMTILVTVTDEAGNVYEIPHDVLMMYKKP